MIPLPIVGGSYDGPRDEVNPQRAINLFPVRDKTGGQDHLRHTPGLVELGDLSDDDLGDELITNGDFDTDSDWTYDEGQWDITGGQLTRAPGGGDPILGPELIAASNDRTFDAGQGNWVDNSGSYVVWSATGGNSNSGCMWFKGTATPNLTMQLLSQTWLDIAGGQSFQVQMYGYNAGGDSNDFELLLGDDSGGLESLPGVSPPTLYKKNIDYNGGFGKDFIMIRRPTGGLGSAAYIDDISVKEITGYESTGADNVEQVAADMAGTPEEGETYRLTFTIVSISGGSVTPYVAGTAGDPIVSAGDYSVDIVAGASGGVKFAATASLTIVMDDVSIVRVLDPQRNLRGAHEINGVLYVVHGRYLKQVDHGATPWTATILNSSLPMGTKDGRVTLAHVSNRTDGHHLMICDGTSVAYLYDTTDGTFVTLTEASHEFLGGGSVTAQDGYLISNRPGTIEYYHSALQDGTSWDPLDQGTAEARTENINLVFSHHRELWAFKEKQIELFYNSGDVDLVFKRRGGGTIEIGTIAPWSVAEESDILFWLANDFTVRRASGYLPVVVSTERLSYEIEQMARDYGVTDAEGFAYTHEGHCFYQLTFPAANRTVVYDDLTGEWHERASYHEVFDDYSGRHRASIYVKFDQKHVVGDYRNNKLYYFDYGAYKDDEYQIYRERIMQKIANNRQRFRFDELELDMITGVGLDSGQGNDPEVIVSMSRDGGNKYGMARRASFGAKGETQKRVRFQRWGQFREAVVKVQISDPVPVYLYGAYGRIRGGLH